MKKIPQPVYYFIVAALLGGYIYFFERGPVKPDNGKDKDKKAQIFENYVADDINEIKLENLSTTVTAKTTIVLQKDNKDVWQIIEPHPFKADEGTVRGLLSSAADYHPDSTIENPADLAEFGLNTPNARCSFTSKSGTAYTLLVGDKNVTGASTYVKTPFKNDIYIVQAYLIDNLLKGVNDYRDKAFFSTDSVLAQKIRVVRDGKTTVFEKDKDGAWNMTEPIKAKADDQKVKDLLTAVNGLKIAGYPDDHPSNLAIYGLSKPHGSVEVWSSNAKEAQAILVGRKKLKTTQYFAKSGSLPYVFLIEGSFDKTLDINPTDYRDKSLLKFDSSQAKTLTVTHLGKTYVYQKDDKGQWTCDGRAKAQDEAVYTVNTLSSMGITDFGSKKDATGLKKPNYTVEVQLSTGTKRVYRFGNVQKSNVFLASDISKDVYVVPDMLITQMDGYYNTMLTPIPVSSPVSK